MEDAVLFLTESVQKHIKMQVSDCIPATMQYLKARIIQPDMIVLAGDMITAGKKENFQTTLNFITTLMNHYPVYYAFGTHEQKMIAGKERYKGMGERFEKALMEKGIHPLRNEHVLLQEYGVILYGLEISHAYFKRFEKLSMPDEYIKELIGERRDDHFSVLLAHNPDYFPEYARWGADLVLSGHIHGGIIRIPFAGGVISPAIRFFPKYDGGLFLENESRMVLGRGIGTHSPDIRVFNPGDKIIIETSNINLLNPIYH